MGSGTSSHASFGSSYTGTDNDQTIFVKVESGGSTFEWYIQDTTQGGTPTPTGTPVATGVATSTSPISLGSTGITITFTQTTGLTVGDYWHVDVKNYLSGDFRFDNASIQHITKMYIHDVSRDNDDMQALIRTFDDSTSNVKGHLTFTRQNDPTEFAVFRLSLIHI